MRSWRVWPPSPTTSKWSARPRPPVRRVLTEFVRNRHPEVVNIDLAVEVAGSALAAALVVSVENWGRNGCAGDLGELVAASLDLVRSGLAPLR